MQKRKVFNKMDNLNKVISKLGIKIANLEIANANLEATNEALQEERQKLLAQVEQLKQPETSKIKEGK